MATFSLSNLYRCFMLTLLLGCSTPKVYIASSGYKPETILELTNEMQNLGFETELINIEISTQYKGTTLIYNPSNRKLEKLNSLKHLLISMGVNIYEEQNLGQDKQFYSKNNIGLYLINPSNSKYVPPVYLKSQFCPQGSSVLYFNPNGQVTLEADSPKGFDFPIVRKIGKWEYDGKILTLYFEGYSPIKYLHSHKTVDTYVGSMPADAFVLKTKNNLITGLQCDLIIIYMDN